LLTGGLEVSATQKGMIETPRPKEMLFNVADDSLQLNNLAQNAAYAGKLQMLRSALDQWTKETGDTQPNLEDMTPDRNDRETWMPVKGLSWHPEGGEDWPGRATKAWTINRSGPIKD